MRVLQCIWRLSIGGTEGQLTRLASGLSRRGIDVHVVTALPGDLDSAVACPMHRIAPLFKYDPSAFLQLATLSRRLRPDVIHTFLTQMDIVGGAAATILRIPWVLSERSNVNAYPPALRHRMRAMIGKQADAIVANSPAGADYWRRVAPGVARIRVIPNAIPHTEIDAAAPLADPPPGELILYAGRLSPEKNLKPLLAALAPILRERNATAAFCGDGMLRKELEQKTRDLGIEGRTRFAGNVPNVWSWMKSASAIVAVSTFEGNPNAVLEAAAAGVPLILSDIPAHRAVFGDDAARFVDGSMPESITIGILDVLENRQEALARARRAREAIGSRTEDEILSQYEQVYREVIS